MLIKLEPVNHEFNDCYQGVIETIVEKFYHKNYLHTQLGRWRNYLDVIGGELGFNLEGADIFGEELRSIGLQLVRIVCSDIQETIEKIKEELSKGVPVIAEIQIANCPWDPNFEKEFVMEHGIIIHGYDEKEDAFFCCDTIYEKKEAELPVRLFEIGGASNYQMIIPIDEDAEEKSLNELLIEVAKKMTRGENSDFIKLRRVASYVIENADKIEVSKKHLDNVLFSRIYMEIRDFAKTREMLDYVLKQDTEYEQLAAAFELSMKKWLNIRILYVRACTTEDRNRKNKYIGSIGKKIEEIIVLEEHLANAILTNKMNEIDTGFLQEMKNRKSIAPSSKKEKVIRKINLKDYYNNKAFGIFDNAENACFSVSDEYMIRPENGFQIVLENGQEVCLDIENKMDNVIANAQKIAVNLTDVEELYVVGTTEYGGEEDLLIVEYTSKEREEIPLDFPEWYTEIMNDVTLVAKCDAIERENGAVNVTSFAGKIFMKKFVLANNEIANIILPKEGRIHIFNMFVM